MTCICTIPRPDSRSTQLVATPLVKKYASTAHLYGKNRDTSPLEPLSYHVKHTNLRHLFSTVNVTILTSLDYHLGKPGYVLLYSRRVSPGSEIFEAVVLLIYALANLYVLVHRGENIQLPYMYICRVHNRLDLYKYRTDGWCRSVLVIIAPIFNILLVQKRHNHDRWIVLIVLLVVSVWVFSIHFIVRCLLIPDIVQLRHLVVQKSRCRRTVGYPRLERVMLPTSNLSHRMSTTTRMAWRV
jgi:hypothetical protein